MKFETTAREALQKRFEDITFQFEILTRKIKIFETKYEEQFQDLSHNLEKGKNLIHTHANDLEMAKQICKENTNKRANSLKELENKLRALDLTIDEMENRRLGLRPTKHT